MAKKKVSQKAVRARQAGIKVPNMSATIGQKALVIGAFTWGTMRDEEKRAAFEKGALLAVAPHQWENMMRDQQIQSQSRDNLREELRVANMKLEQLDKRFRSEQADHMHGVELLRSELSKARDDAARITRAMHALIDGISSPRSHALAIGDVLSRLPTNGKSA